MGLLSKRMDRKIDAYQRELIETHYREVDNMYRQIRGWRHDYRGHIQAMKALAAAGVGVEYMYAFISRDEGRACVILRFTQEDTDKAVAALQAASIEILDAGRIYSM